VEVVDVVVSVASGTELALEGRLDTRSVSYVRETLHAAIDAGAGDLVVDVSGVELVDLTGLGVLVGADRRARQAGRRIVLRHAGPSLQRVLRLTNLHRVLTVEPGHAA
jgi:anti-anti-sigma factor